MVKIEGYELPDELYYWKDHSWARVENGIVRVGITDLMQANMGKLLFISLRKTGTKVEQGKPVGSLETGKWVGTVKAPVSGTIVEVNEELRRSPKLVHEDPYEKGWMVAIKPEKLEEDLKALYHGDAAVEWYKAEIEKWAKRR